MTNEPPDDPLRVHATALTEAIGFVEETILTLSPVETWVEIGDLARLGVTRINSRWRLAIRCPDDPRPRPLSDAKVSEKLLAVDYLETLYHAVSGKRHRLAQASREATTKVLDLVCKLKGARP